MKVWHVLVACVVFLGIVAWFAIPAMLDPQPAGLADYGQAHHIRQFSAGALVGEWDSTGGVVPVERGGYRFRDARTGKLVDVSGDVQVTVK